MNNLIDGLQHIGTWLKTPTGHEAILAVRANADSLARLSAPAVTEPENIHKFIGGAFVLGYHARDTKDGQPANTPVVGTTPKPEAIAVMELPSPHPDVTREKFEVIMDKYHIKTEHRLSMWNSSVTAYNIISLIDNPAPADFMNTVDEAAKEYIKLSPSYVEV